MFKPTDAVCDVMAGVGPFAMPASKKGCMVYANDLNPTSYKYMLENKGLNKVNFLFTLVAPKDHFRYWPVENSLTLEYPCLIFTIVDQGQFAYLQLRWTRLHPQGG